MSGKGVKQHFLKPLTQTAKEKKSTDRSSKASKKVKAKIFTALGTSLGDKIFAINADFHYKC